MNAALRRAVAVALIGIFLLFAKPAKADTLKTDATLIIVGIVAVTAAITVAVVLVVAHKPSITGCASGGPGGLSLKDESDGKIYALRGDIASISAGQRVRVSGKRKKNADPAEFDVAKVKKTMGACPAA